jgi:hypothetical protein
VPVVAETLDASGRGLHNRNHTLWAWLGRTPGGEPALVLSVTSQAARTFEDRGPGQVLARSVAAVFEAGGGPGLRLGDWLGHAVLIDPGLDPELAAVALEEAHPPPARVSLARLPQTVHVAATPVVLAPAPAAAATPLTELAARAGVHPVEAALALATQGLAPEAAATVAPELVVRMARAPVVPPQVDDDPDEIAWPPIDADPLPRRRQARRLLRRLFGMKKIGPVHHTAFDHLYRGVPADDRHDALDVGEALVRAGLLGEKPSVGQRHVYLRREALPRIHALMERGETDDLELARALGIADARDGLTAPRPSP